MTKIRKNVLGFALVAMMVLSTIFSVPTHAAEISNQTETTEDTPAPRAGRESLPLGIYNIGSFTFTDTNLTPVKTPQGRYIAFSMGFKKASIDTGIGAVKLTVHVRDAITGQVISENFTANNIAANTWSVMVTKQIDLGYANRPIQIWFDASSLGQSNGNFRSISVQSLTSNVSNEPW